jgi:hypothetical protein
VPYVEANVGLVSLVHDRIVDSGGAAPFVNGAFPFNQTNAVNLTAVFMPASASDARLALRAPISRSSAA